MLQQFESVFTRETPLTEQHRAPQEYPDISDLTMTFTVKGVLKMLEELDVSIKGNWPGPNSPLRTAGVSHHHCPYPDEPLQPILPDQGRLLNA